ncbi:MAG TPA: hypothetical protein QF487_06965 [Acidimicrobiales bacterium]|nr:hypothetical protein [Acidimicrobiales bacterium]
MDSVSRISALDGIRGLSVLVVVIYHAWPSTLPGGWWSLCIFYPFGILDYSDSRP